MKYLYRLLSKENKVIYVGKTLNLHRRMLQHAKDKIWFNEVYDIQYHLFDNNTDCDIYEIYYINKLNPIYNRDSKNERIFSQELTEISFDRLTVVQFIFLGQNNKKTVKSSIPVIHLNDFSLFNSEVLREYKKSQFEYKGNIIRIEFSDKYYDLYNYLLTAQELKNGLTLSKQDVSRFLAEKLNIFVNNIKHPYIKDWKMNNGHLDIAINNIETIINN